MTGDLRNLFSLPGGELAFAVGAEYRSERSEFTPDDIIADGLTFTGQLAPSDGKFNVKGAFLELRQPLLSEVPLAHRLQSGGAVRVSDYSTIGGTTAWQSYGTYAPARDIAFNATYSRAVRAPNIVELFGASNPFQVSSPTLAASRNFRMGPATGKPIARPC